MPCFFLAKVAPREGESMEQQVEEVTAEQPNEEPQVKAEVRSPHQGPQRDGGDTELAYRLEAISIRTWLT